MARKKIEEAAPEAEVADETLAAEVEETPAGPDLDSPCDVLTPEMAAALRGPKPVNKPDISGLRDALDEEGNPLYIVGDRIVVERYGHIGGRQHYLETRTYRVDSINQENGNVWLFDVSLHQHAGDNFKTGPRGGNVYKFAAGTSTVLTKKRRGRPRKNPAAAAAPPPKLGPDGKPEKKRRGRPPGSKNRAKAVVAAEKATKVAAAALKRKAR
jgi:hypothetical protein